jgi:hypothetical protein
LFFSHLVSFGLDILFKYLDFGHLRITVVHHLVKQLIGDNEVISNRFILYFFEVLAEHILHFVKERKHESHVRVALGDGHDVDIVNADPHVGYVLLCEHRLDESLVKFEDLSLELLCDARAYFASVVSRYNDLALLVKEVYG